MMEINYGTPDNPCHGCRERCVGCHDNCDGYKDFQKRNEEIKKKIRRERNKDEWARREWRR